MSNRVVGKSGSMSESKTRDGAARVRERARERLPSRLSSSPRARTTLQASGGGMAAAAEPLAEVGRRASSGTSLSRRQRVRAPVLPLAIQPLLVEALADLG